LAMACDAEKQDRVWREIIAKEQWIDPDFLHAIDKKKNYHERRWLHGHYSPAWHA